MLVDVAGTDWPDVLGTNWSCYLEEYYHSNPMYTHTHIHIPASPFFLNKYFGQFYLMFLIRDVLRYRLMSE